MAALTGIAGPAVAAPEDEADLGVSVPGPMIAVNSAGKNVRIDVVSNGPAVATNARLTLEVADISDMVTVTLPGENEDCATVSGKVVCDLGDLPAAGNEQTVTVTVEPKDDAQTGPIGTLTASVSSDTPDSFAENNTATVELQLVPDAADLIAFSADLSLNQGETGDLGFGLENDGTEDLEFFDVAVKLPSFVLFAENLEHCEYEDSDSATAICHYSNLPADEGFSESFPIKLAASAPGPVALAGGTIAGIAVEPSPALARSSNANKVKEAKLGAVPKSLDSDDASPGDDTIAFTVFSGPNTIDLAVAAASASGAVGATVGVTFTLTNNGPASGGAGITLKAPSGTVFLNTPDGEQPECHTGDDDFDFVEATEATCSFEGVFQPGITFSRTLNFKIKSSPIGDDGQITVADQLGTPESNPANNTAAIIITIAGSGGGLPVTGVQVGVIGGVGAAAVVLGAVLLLLARRRRTVTTVLTEDAGE